MTWVLVWNICIEIKVICWFYSNKNICDELIEMYLLPILNVYLFYLFVLKDKKKEINTFSVNFQRLYIDIRAQNKTNENKSLCSNVNRLYLFNIFVERMKSIWVIAFRNNGFVCMSGHAFIYFFLSQNSQQWMYYSVWFGCYSGTNTIDHHYHYHQHHHHHHCGRALVVILDNFFVVIFFSLSWTTALILK